MPEINLAGDARDRITVQATMYFPNDDNLRRQFCTAVQARAQVLDAEDDEQLRVDKQTLTDLLEAPDYGRLTELTTEAIKGGIVAGDILGTLFLMDRAGIEASMNKAIYVAQRFARRVKYGDGTALDISEAYIRDHWKELKSVAHLWAAFRLNKAYPFTARGTEFSSGLESFLGVASAVFNFGCSFIPKRSEDPILDPLQSWTLPTTVQPRIWKSKRLPNKLIKWLNKYKVND